MTFLVRRTIVFLFALTLIVLSLVGLSHDVHLPVMIAHSLTLIISAYGLYGTFYCDHMHLRWFTALLFVLWCYVAILTILNLLQLHPVKVVEDIVTIGVMFVGWVVAADLTLATRHSAGFTPLSDSAGAV